MSVRVTVVVPARDAQESLPRTLAGLDREAAAHEVIVVDNGSQDRTAEVAERSPVVTRVLRRARGEGPGAARNVGAAAATGSVLAFIDADCRPERGWLAAGIEALADAELVQGKVMPDPNCAVGPFDRTLSVGHASGLFESANLFVRRELFKRLGGFPAGLEPGRSGRGQGGAPFGEDVMFGWAARRAGARTTFCQSAVVYHDVTSRTPAEYVAERARLSMFPELAAAVPELRDCFFYRRIFMSRRSARLDLALAGAVLGLARGKPALLLTAAPYLLAVGADSKPWGRRRAPLVALTGLTADVVGALALARGSLSSGSPVL